MVRTKDTADNNVNVRSFRNAYESRSLVAVIAGKSCTCCFLMGLF